MEDSEARFARRLGLAVGRLDWWRIKDEHTPYEWALQQTADIVDPIGETRADMRAAAAVVQIVKCLLSEPSPELLEAIGDHARNYLPVNAVEPDRTLLPEEAEALKRELANVSQ